jgi:protein-disulfide isomerase
MRHVTVLTVLAALTLAALSSAWSQGAPPAHLDTIEVSIDGASAKGNPQAKITLVEFSDFQCPHCARHAQRVMAQIQHDYIDTGKVRYVVRHMPLEAIHADAFKAAEAAECAGAQGKFWEMYARLFAHQRALGATELPRHAQAVGLDLPKFQQCLDGGEKTAKVRRDLDDSVKAGLTVAPSFLIGVVRPGEPTMRVLRKVHGPRNPGVFRDALDAALVMNP